MVVELSKALYAWLQSMAVLQEDNKSRPTITDESVVLHTHQLIYLENGYVIGAVLRRLLKDGAAEGGGEALMRVRKIAHITSNENWRIIGDILKQIGWEGSIDPDQVPHSQLEDMLDFLFRSFGPKKHQNLAKAAPNPSHIDPVTFDPRKSINSSTNLLEFIALVSMRGLGISMGEFLGLMVSDGRNFKKTVVMGAGRQGFSPVIKIYQLIVQNMPTLNRLVKAEPSNQDYALGCLGVSVLSQNTQLNKLGCLMLNNLTSQGWLQRAGWLLMLRSPHQYTLQQLLKTIDPHFHLLFTPNMHQQFPNPTTQLRHYRNLVKFIYRSVHSRTILKLLPLSYYMSRANRLFQPDNIAQAQPQAKMAAKHLLATISTLFWNKMNPSDKGQVHYAFDPSFCVSSEERYGSVCHLFDIVTQIDSPDSETGRRFFGRIQQYYNNGSQGIKQFIIEQYLHLYRTHKEVFPIEMFLANYQLQSTLQPNHFTLLAMLAARKDLSRQEVNSLLKICSGYFQTQLLGREFAKSIRGLVRQYGPKNWGQEMAEDILSKWMDMKIPTFESAPPNTTNIKTRSVGIKKKQMLQFTEVNRNKTLLLVLSEIKNVPFLQSLRSKVVATLNKVEKSKSMQLRSTKQVLNQLLNRIENTRLQIKEENAWENEMMKRAESAMPVYEQDEYNYPLSTSSRLLQQDAVSVEEKSEIAESKLLDSIREQKSQPAVKEDESENQFIVGEKRPAPMAETPSLVVPLLLPFTEEQDVDRWCGHGSEELLEQYELLFVKQLNQKYKQVVDHACAAYQSVNSLKDFFGKIQIDTYLKGEMNYLEHLHKSIRLKHQSTEQIVKGLLLEAGLAMFEFKKGRRVTIKCLESFYELLEHRNSIISKPMHLSQFDNPIQAKMNFTSSVAPSLLKPNHISSHAVCFDLVSQLLYRAVGVHAVEPMSKVVSSIGMARSGVISKEQLEELPPRKALITPQEDHELNQLQQIIESEVNSPQVNKEADRKSNNLKKKTSGAQEPQGSSLASSEVAKLTEIKRKVAQRRLQMQKQRSKNVKALNP